MRPAIALQSEVSIMYLCGSGSHPSCVAAFISLTLRDMTCIDPFLAPTHGTFILIVRNVTHMFEPSFIVDSAYQYLIDMIGCCPATSSLLQVRFASQVLPLPSNHTSNIGSLTVDYLLLIPLILTRSGYVLFALLIFFTKYTFLSPGFSLLFFIPIYTISRSSIGPISSPKVICTTG